MYQVHAEPHQVFGRSVCQFDARVRRYDLRRLHGRTLHGDAAAALEGDVVHELEFVAEDDQWRTGPRVTGMRSLTSTVKRKLSFESEHVVRVEELQHNIPAVAVNAAEDSFYRDVVEHYFFNSALLKAVAA